MKIYASAQFRPPKSVWIVAIVTLSIFMAWLFTSGTSHAGAFADAQAFGKSKNSGAVGALKGMSVNSNTVPGYTTAHPPQAAYQNNPGALSNAGTTAAAKDATGVGKFIIHSAATRAQFKFTINDPLMQRSKSIYKNAQALAGIGASTSTGTCRNVVTTTPDSYRTYSCSTGKTSNVFSNHVCTTGLTPDVFSNHTCTSGRTADVIGNYACTRGRTPDIFSNHACIVKNDPDTFTNHRCYTGRKADKYKNYTCTKSRPITPSTCDRALVVTTTSLPYCNPGQTLASSSMGGIAGPGTYGSPGYMTFTAQCGAPGGWTNVYIRGANWLGSCDSFKWYRGLGHLNVNIPPWPTGWNYAGLLYYIKWSGYFYCIYPPKVYYQSHGCSGNNCSATFKVDDGTTKQGCSNGTAVAQRRVFRCSRRGRCRWRQQNYCSGAPTRVYGWYKWRRRWRYGWHNVPPHIIQVPNYKYSGLSWTRAHNIITYHDQWVNQACK